jgi:hypothetical protein
MADKKQLAILKRGVEVWNAWRKENQGICPDLRKTNLSGADLRNADLSETNLSGAFLHQADLSGADLSEANLSGRHLRGRRSHKPRDDLTPGAFLRYADLRNADLSGAFLHQADLSGADLSEANLKEARLSSTIFANVNLSRCKGLDSCHHFSSSIIDPQTLQRSGPLPLAFLRGVGLPDNLIDYLPSLLNQPIQFYSCFISYSSKDQRFAERVHADLQAKGVRCWFAPHDMPIGAKILDTLDEAIRLRDKVLLILSEYAIASDWVEGEVTRALDEERERKRPLLFPIRIDNAVLETKEAWARLLRGQRHIGDFRRWKEHDAYEKALERLLRDLQVERA